MMTWQGLQFRMVVLACALMVLLGVAADGTGAQNAGSAGKTRLAVIGLDHDHVWSLLKDMAGEPSAELIAIAESDAGLVARAQKQVPAGVKFYTDYVAMLDEAKPDGVIVTTSNDKHLEILRQCAKRHIHYSAEKPMAVNAADAREMERLANEAKIKLMVNYWNAWVAPSHDLFHRVRAGEVGPVQKIVVQYGHHGPKEIGVSPQFANWLYDPVKNGGGAIMDFGCYGAEWSIWLKGRPSRVYATTRKLKVEQNNKVDDDATIVLEYPDAAAVIEASWDWPYSKDVVAVYGPKGSLLARHSTLQRRLAEARGPDVPSDGESLTLEALPKERSNPISYFVDCIRNDKPIEDPVSARLNVQVMEILDAARESARTGKPQELR
jgi:predicted dehydrogenase